jgi:hypothetical protein
MVILSLQVKVSTQFDEIRSESDCAIQFDRWTKKTVLCTDDRYEGQEMEVMA